jgi:hypothetical protein
MGWIQVGVSDILSLLEEILNMGAVLDRSFPLVPASEGGLVPYPSTDFHRVPHGRVD